MDTPSSSSSGARSSGSAPLLPIKPEPQETSLRRCTRGGNLVIKEGARVPSPPPGFEPEGHVRAHHKEKPEHRWFANSDNTDVLYCCECNQEVPLKVFKYRPSQNKGTAKSAEASTELGPNTKTLDPKDDDGLDKKEVVTPQQIEPVEVEGKGSSSSSSPHSEDDDGLDKKEVVTPQMKLVEAEDKGSSNPSSPHSEDITKEPVSICQSEEIAKEDVAKCNVIRGLPNAGNTCFFNAMLQCLLALDPPRSIMMGRNVCTGPIAALFKELFVDTSASSNAKDFLDQRKLFTYMKRKMKHEDEARQPSMDASKKVTIVNSIFAGEESSAISSTEYVHGSDKRERTLLFRLPIPHRKHHAVASRSNNKADAEVHGGDDPVSIEHCFSLYTEKELIPDWFCRSCTDTANTNTSETKTVVESGGDDNQNNQKQETTKVSRAARKRLLITRAPDVMVVSLMRQQSAPNIVGYVKLEGHVRFKEILDMQPYMDKRFDENDNNTYRLVGVAQHIGDRKGGHYIVYVRASKMNGQEHLSNDKSWFYASDKIIREASLQEVLGCEAYILLYERCSTHEAQSSSANVTSEEPRLGGCGSREMYILYSHLLSQSKDLAMGVCNGDERLRVKLTEIARNYMLKLVTSLNMVVTESTRNLMQQLDLRFLEMPNKYEELKESLGADLLRNMDVYGHVGEQIMIPLRDKCALIQGLTEYVISKHRAGYSWEGNFGIEDMDVYDGKYKKKASDACKQRAQRMHAESIKIPPPIHPEDPDSPLPETILIDSFGYLSDRTNATTASGRRSRTKKKGKRILVTF
ncbi:uncharacterized protein [Aegilops tauschii subsp. strangulata]|uniref:uncharacterized protein n=1 Tax=Aegilops tauschii subsp. strangulata TaxID=200361 RepID=UPI003CC8A755